MSEFVKQISTQKGQSFVTINELSEFAKSNDIDIGSAKSKAEITDAIIQVYGKSLVIAREVLLSRKVDLQNAYYGNLKKVKPLVCEFKSEFPREKSKRLNNQIYRLNGYVIKDQREDICPQNYKTFVINSLVTKLVESGKTKHFPKVKAGYLCENEKVFITFEENINRVTLKDFKKTNSGWKKIAHALSAQIFYAIVSLMYFNGIAHGAIRDENVVVTFTTEKYIHYEIVDTETKQKALDVYIPTCGYLLYVVDFDNASFYGKKYTFAHRQKSIEAHLLGDLANCATIFTTEEFDPQELYQCAYNKYTEIQKKFLKDDDESIQKVITKMGYTLLECLSEWMSRDFPQKPVTKSVINMGTQGD